MNPSLLLALLQAGACPSGPGAAWVSVHLPQDAAGARGSVVMAHLRAHLAGRGLEVCPAGADASLEAFAGVDVIVTGTRAVITVTEPRGDRGRLTRPLDLGPLPADGRSLALAIAVDELLRAHGATPPPPPPAPPPAPAIVATRPPPPRPLPLRLAVQGGAEHWTGAHTLLGPTVMVGTGEGRLGAELQAGWRWGRPVTAPDGRVSTQGPMVGLGLRFRPLATARPGWWLDLGAAVAVARLSVSGQPHAGAIGRSGTGTAAWSSVDATLGRTIAGVDLFVRAAFGHALRPVRFEDGGHEVGALSGRGAALSLGVGWDR